jgi:hypothetical protein
VPLSSLLGATETHAELADRSGFIPGETLRQHIADTIGSDSRTEVLFTRLLTDDGGRLLDTTELGRSGSTRLGEAITIRAGTCRFPMCTVPADRATLIIINLTLMVRPLEPMRTRFVEDIIEARHSPGSPASETTTAWTGRCPTPNTTDALTSRCLRQFRSG